MRYKKNIAYQFRSPGGRGIGRVVLVNYREL